MSQHLIARYLNELADLRRVSGTVRETVLREPFKALLKDWGRAQHLTFVAEFGYETPAREHRLIDGALLHELRVPFGYWEAKDQEDDLDREIARKFRRGYPQDNIIFENAQDAVLYQDRREVMRCPVRDPDRLERLLGLFFAHQRPEIAGFRKAVAQFRTDLPAVLAALRAMIDGAEANNPAFRAAAAGFLTHARETINPSVTAADVREMLIQHILTEEIFAHVFDNADFHRHNNVARELYRLEDSFFTGGLKHRALEALKPYYAAIRSAAALVSSHHEKQQFLKVVYENFYKVYNPKAADRLGVVYTPNEIVRFMVEGADWLCQRHFGKKLIDRNVEILDPAAGTGTFIAELIEHFRGQPDKLKYKYREELHANEVAILPYYVANLNIEASYAALTGEYEEFPNLCFVDTLDNIAGLRERGRQPDLLGALSEENVARIKRQNARTISVVIGNPPYNANQMNENDNNKNREYRAIDRRIKETYIAASTAQKTKLYDMYVRFFRWAADRIDENGIVAFVSNSSFIHKPSLDGVRKILAKEYNDIWIVDLKGDARTAGERRRREGGNIFGNQIKVGVAISFLTRKKGASGCHIRYHAVRDCAGAEEKSDFLRPPIWERQFDELQPDGNGNWIGTAPDEFSAFLPIADRVTKSVKTASQERAIFKLFSLGVATNRDDWLYSFDCEDLKSRITVFTDHYECERARWHDAGRPKDVYDWVKPGIKWTRELRAALTRDIELRFNPDRIRIATYRAFANRYLHYDKFFVHCLYQQEQIFPLDRDVNNIIISFSDVGSRTDYCVLASNHITDLHFGAAVDASQQVPRYRFNGGERIDNITDWALEQFREHYAAEERLIPDLPEKNSGGSPPPKPSPLMGEGRGGGDAAHRFLSSGRGVITKDAIFHYVYGVLHDPAYREKYALNLKREFPRIPFCADFRRWAAWGERLMALHIGYESVEPWPLTRLDVPDEKSRAAGLSPRVLLRADKAAGIILIDSETQLGGVPKEAWDYRLGNRSALEWVLDQHREKTPKDPTIRARFNTYRFADHKERVIDLLKRVARVSVETMAILAKMREAGGER